MEMYLPHTNSQFNISIPQFLHFKNGNDRAGAMVQVVEFPYLASPRPRVQTTGPPRRKKMDITRVPMSHTAVRRIKQTCLPLPPAAA
jgi:hypothetical protein